jgi:hypothetical protein
VSNLDYPGDCGQYGPSVSFPEYHGYDAGCKPVYCDECGVNAVDRKGQICRYCIILITEGEAAAEAWYLARARRSLSATLSEVSL